MAKAKKGKSAGKAKKGKPGGKGSKDKTGSKVKDGKSGSEESKETSGSEEKKSKSGSKERNDKSGSKKKKDKSGGKKKKDKSGSKEKKDKSGGKKKKDKPGGKKKKGSKGPSSGTKSGSASSSKEKLSSQQKAKGGASSSDSVTSSTAGQVPVSATSSEGLFKPLKRQPFPPLVLPGDRELTLVRRPNTVYVWNWRNMWFFPVSVVAMALIVVGMVIMSLDLQEAGELQAEGLNATGVGNGTTVDVTPTTPSWTEGFHSMLPTSVPKRRRRAHEQHPNTAMPSFPRHLSPSNTRTEMTRSAAFIAAKEAVASTALINAEWEAHDESSKADSSDVDATEDWLHAPRKDWQDRGLSHSPLTKVTPSKAVETDEWNATTAKVDES
ncbi:uncharacterized protein [Dermacentor andersoni]|uniref:uncharacterized protein n=1 Tax=Dermacentor andersoni TaxID=34620 RepID=UPI003B3B6801